MTIQRRDCILAAPTTPEDEELIRWRAAPDEALVRFRHNTATGPGDYRRVKVNADALDDTMRRCAKEFGT